MGAIGEILAHLVHTYRNRTRAPRRHSAAPAPGFDVDGQSSPVRFVGDIVLANVHFKLGWRTGTPPRGWVSGGGWTAPDCATS